MVSHKRHLQSSDPLLIELTRLYGVQTSYRDSRGRWRESPAESIVQVLRALGAELGDGDAGDPLRGVTPALLTTAIRERKREVWSRVLEPVIVAWEGKLPPITVRLPVTGKASGQVVGRTLGFTLLYEGGGTEHWEVSRDCLELAEAVSVGLTRFAAYRVPHPIGGAPAAEPSRFGRNRPLGYHRLRVETREIEAEATVISAPVRCWAAGQPLGRDSGASGAATTLAAAGESARDWGVFAPLYALRSERNWGAGDLADLGMLRDWVAEGGGSVVATLPLLAAYLDRPFEPAPYRPVSRLFWNEFYLAVEQIPEWERCTAARELFGSSGIQRRVHALREESSVDYRAVMTLKRGALEELASCFFRGAEVERLEAFSAYMAAHADAGEYAAFRAGVEVAGEDWRSWRDELSADGLHRQLPPGSLEVQRYHLYCQWQMEEQLGRPPESGAATATVSAEAGRPSPGLFLDLPLGVHPGGFDTWRWPRLFATGMSAGAPPDSFFAMGQDWESPPLHPERIREKGHLYFARCIRHHMRHARYLRIDHVMSLHRLFWVPEWMEPTDGVYVTYPTDELYGVLCLESRRNQTIVVGEDLGTVPAGVRFAMRRHGVLGTWALQSSLRPRAARLVDDVPRHVVASLNTHDMFPFAGFLRGDDIGARMETGQLDREGARRELAERQRLVGRLAAFLPGAPAGETESQTRGSEPEPEFGQVGSATEPATERAAEPREPAAATRLSHALAYLARSRAGLVVINLEDLLLETRPQNQPGTGAEWGNWRRKAAGSEADARRAIARAAWWIDSAIWESAL